MSSPDPALLARCTPGLAQEATENDLGYGHLYYALVRQLRPRHVLVIGSGYGFAPAVLARALMDNGAGHLTFVDPSMSGGGDAAWSGTGQWDTPDQVLARFGCAGVSPDVMTHYRETNDAFFSRWNDRNLPPIDLALIDGAHDEYNAAFDLRGVVEHLSLPGYVLMHDATHFLNRTGHMGVTSVIERTRASGDVEAVAFPGAAGLVLLRFKARSGIEVRALPQPSITLALLALLAAGAGIGYVIGRRGR